MPDEAPALSVSEAIGPGTISAVVSVYLTAR